MMHVLLHWDKALSFIKSATLEDGGGIEAGGALITYLVQMVDDLYDRTLLHLELKVVECFCKPFVRATYILETDSCASVVAFDIVQLLRGHAIDDHWEPNTPAVTWPAIEAAIDCAVEQFMALPKYLDNDRAGVRLEVVKEVMKMIAPAIQYFKYTTLANLAPQLTILKGCRLANPLFMRRANPTCAQFREGITEMNMFVASDIDGMVSEYSEYKALCADVQLDEPNPAKGPRDMLDSFSEEIIFTAAFWKQHATRFVFLPKYVQVAFTIQTSSAAAERVFSYLKDSFGDRQHGAMEDYIALSMMTRYNSRK